MQIRATITPQELRDFLAELFPCDIRIAPEDSSKRIHVERPHDITFRGDDGVVRVESAGVVHWPVPVIGDRFPVDKVVVDLIPRVVTTPTGQQFELRFRVPALDVRNVPSILDSAILSRINGNLEKLDVNVRWDFCDTLTNRLDLPRDIIPASGLTMFVTRGEVTVRNDGLELAVPMVFHLQQSDMALPTTG